MFENVPTVSTAERQQVVAALERLQAKLVQREEWTHSDNLGNLRETLQSPLFNHILTLQHSIKQLRTQLSSMPPDACSDISFSRKGQLIMSAVNVASNTSPPTLSASSVLTNGAAPPSHQTPPSSDLLQEWIHIAAKGRPTELVSLTRPLSGGLGFSVVGLNPSGSSSRGVFVKHIQPGGIAHRDGRLQERDQILVINGSPLEPGISQQQALTLLQQPGENIELVVAREQTLNTPPLPSAAPVSTGQWGHMEEIELVNDGSGLGFGIVGGKTTGVVVRTLIPDSVADRDGRLRTGDHILCIGSTPTSGLTSDQVVKVLQGCGNRVSMLIARDPKGQGSAAPPPPPPPPDSAPVSSLPPQPPQRRLSKTPNLEGYEIHEVPLTKKEGQSLGISIIGYNPLTSQDAVGVFVKHVVPGSAADQSGNIRVHDRLIALDGVSVHGLTNQEVLQVMKQTGDTVVLTVVRKKGRSLERSLDKVERESSRVSLKRTMEIKARSSGFSSSTVTTTKQDSAYTAAAQPMRATEAELRAKWEQALGPQYQVLVVNLDPVIEDDAELQKSSKLLPIHTLRLGVELDSFDGHHYISSVAPGGPVDKHGVLRPEDELLEVNDVQLYGKSRREAVSFLKEVPPPFTLVCCRHPTSELEPEPESEPEQEPEQQLATRLGPGASVEEIEVKLSSMLCDQTELRDEPRTISQDRTVSVEEVLKEEITFIEDDDDEDEGELALWSPDIQVLALHKERDKGLGFSILDYQDPLDPGRCVMVIRSLVSGGSAERHGGLLPGDQLVSVNHSQLDLLSLSQAVQVLKSAPPGTVRLGIRKPLVLDGSEKKTEDTRQTSVTSTPISGPKDHHRDSEEEEEPELILDGGLPRYTSSSVTAADLPVEEEEEEEEGKEMAVDEEEEEEKEEEEEEEEEEEVEAAEQKGDSLPRKPPPSWEEWKLASLGRTSGAEKNQVEVKQDFMDQEDQDLRPDQDHVESVGHLLQGVVDSRDSEADSELTLTDTDTESARIVNTEKRRRRNRGGASLPIRGSYSDLPEREAGEGEETPAFSHWGPPRRVEVWPEEGQSLGLSIVGGRNIIKRLRNGEELKGIFIKQVLTDSPAAKTQCLKTGDKILEVSGVDLRTASHNEAVNAIKSAPSPVVFIVQSLSATPRPVSVTAPSYNKHKAKKTESPRPGVTPSPLREPPPYRPPSQAAQELKSDLEQAKGLV